MQELFDAVSKNGMGVVAFVVLIYGGWQLFLLLKEMAAFIQTLASNHLTHIEAHLESIAKSNEEIKADIKIVRENTNPKP